MPSGVGAAATARSSCAREGHTLLLDCGPTTLAGLKELGIDPCEIDAIAISHYHGDHASGVPFLLLDYMYQSRRQKPLDILGPEGIQQRVEDMTRMFGYEAICDVPYPLRYTQFEVGAAMEAAGFVVRPEEAYHHPHTHPHMLRIETDDRALVFSGDTGWTDDLPAKVGENNLFICECVNMEEVFEFHMSHERLERERSNFRSDRIVLTHLGQEVLDNLSRVNFETAADGLRIKL